MAAHLEHWMKLSRRKHQDLTEFTLVHMIYRPSDSELPLLSNDVSAITKQKAIRLGPMRF